MEENKNKKEKKVFNKFGLGNFKSFQNIQEIEVAPITLVFGQNSGGKTSLLQAILSLSQSFQEISEGKFQLSGTKVDAGTFETALNNKNEKGEIIIETTNENTFKPNSFSERRSFFIDSFIPIKTSRVRFFIKTDIRSTNLFISKIEIIFSDYLKDLKLEFEKKLPFGFEDILLNYISPRNRSSIRFPEGINKYELKPQSKKIIKEITKRCFENLCKNLKSVFNSKEKGKWFNKLTKEYTVDFGKIFERNFRFDDPSFHSFLRHAVINSGGIIAEYRRRVFSNDQFTIKEFDSFATDGLSKEIINIVKESSYKIFKQSLDIFESSSLLPIELQSSIYKERYRYYAEKNFLESPNKHDRVVAEINLITNYSYTTEIFNEDNIFKKIDLIKDKYLYEIINIKDRKKDLILDSYNEVKDYLNIINLKLADLENVILASLEPYKSEYTGDYKLVKSRQYLRDFLISFPFYEIRDIDKLPLENLKDSIIKFFNKLNPNKNKDISDDFELSQIDIIVDLVTNIKILHEDKINNLKDRKVELAKYYKEEDDDDIAYIKSQIIDSITIGFLFRKLSNIILCVLKNKLIQNLIITEKLKNTFGSFNLADTIINTLSSDIDEEIEYEDYEEIKNSVSKLINSEYPRIYKEEINEAMAGYFLKSFPQNIIPSPFSTFPLVSSLFNSEVIHLGPSRAGAKRFYTVKEIENAEPDDVAFFLKIQKYKNNEDEFKIDKFNNYLNSLDIVDEIRADKSKDSRYDFESILVKKKENLKAVNLADTGYGLSQLFPIIINAVTSSFNTILIQQPETHLHPRLQAEVGSILVDSIQKKDFRRFGSNKSWIVETHSEIMLLRILKRIRNGEFDSNNLRVYYVDQNKDKGSIIKRMHVSEDGELITQWPKGFFSNDIDEMFDI